MGLFNGRYRRARGQGELSGLGGRHIFHMFRTLHNTREIIGSLKRRLSRGL